MSNPRVPRPATAPTLPAAALALALVLATGLALPPATAAAPKKAGAESPELARVMKILRRVPLVDGHNDVPWQVRARFKMKVEDFPFDQDTSALEPPMHTDLDRLEAGGVGAQFWSVYVPVSLEGADAVQATLEQIDVVHQLVARFPERLELATTADDIVRIHRAGRIASLIGMEGGHSIGASLGVLRKMYDLGARYMTLTHWKSNRWADAATDAPRHDGLSRFGRKVVREMNRLGMLVDLSHVSAQTMRDALKVTRAPVIFSHSGAMAINPHPRNVPDDVLQAMKANGGVVMVDFLPAYVSRAVWERWAAGNAEKARLEVMMTGDPKGQEAALEAWKAANPAPRSTLAEVVEHVEHIRKVAGVDHIGIGSDFDGMSDAPDGLQDVSAYPALLAELLRRGWSEEDVGKVAGLNLLRVMRGAEAVAKRLSRSERPSNRQFEPEAAP